MPNRARLLHSVLTMQKDTDDPMKSLHPQYQEEYYKIVGNAPLSITTGQNVYLTCLQMTTSAAWRL